MTLLSPSAALLPLPGSGGWDWASVFGRTAPVVLEIGSGKGIFLSSAAKGDPSRDFLGVEIRRKRVEAIAKKIETAALPNARVAAGDIRVVLTAVRPGTLSSCWINFPDPWPKRAHARRRIFANPAFVPDLARSLRPGGELVVATDVGWYAAEIILAILPCAEFEHPWGIGRAAPRPEGYPVSVHEEKFMAWGRPIYFLRFRRRG